MTRCRTDIESFPEAENAGCPYNEQFAVSDGRKTHKSNYARQGSKGTESIVILRLSQPGALEYALFPSCSRLLFVPTTSKACFIPCTVHSYFVPKLLMTPGLFFFTFRVNMLTIFPNDTKGHSFTTPGNDSYLKSSV